MPNNERKIQNRNKAITWVVIITGSTAFFSYLGTDRTHITWALLIVLIGIFTYYSLDYDDDIADLKKRLSSTNDQDEQ